MKKLLVLMSLLTTVSCFGQMKRMTFDFSPSFIELSQVLMEKVKSGYSLTISGKTINEKCILTDASMADLNGLLVDYFQKRKTEDSLEQVRRRIIIEESKKNATNGGVPEIIGEIPADGTSVHGVLVDRNSERSFDIWSPRKGTIDYLLMKKLFDKMDATFKKPETIKYLEQLREHFPYRLN